MSNPEDKGNGISITPPFFNKPVTIKGAASILAVMVAGIGWWFYQEVQVKTAEHKVIREIIREEHESVVKLFEDLAQKFGCKMDLEIWLYTQVKGQVNWGDLPPALYTCAPIFKK